MEEQRAGFADRSIDCVVTAEPLNVLPLLAGASNEANGAVALFVGTVRISSGMPEREGRVRHLEYEAYGLMAEREMNAIAQEALEMFGVTNILAHHRVGLLPVGEIAVIVAVGSPHRAAAFDACRYVIEELKKRVPIWKKEVFTDGALWVDPHP